MSDIKKYWFYLEPYTFIFKAENKYVIYNTLNSAYLKIPEEPILLNILMLLDNSENGYCIELNNDLLHNLAFNIFLLNIRETFSGDIVDAKLNKAKPFIFKPILFLNTNVRKTKEEDLTFLGERILENLNEVSLYLPGMCNLSCSGCGDYYKQILHCTCLDKESLSVPDYLSLLLDLNTAGVNKVNILGGDLLNNAFFKELQPTLAGCKFKKSYHLHYNHLTEACKEWLEEEDTELIVSVHPGYEKEIVKTQMNSFSTYPIIYKFIVSSDADIRETETLDIPADVQMEFIPFFNGENLTFFEEKVFYSLQEIIAEPISRKTIFRRQTLNENFFGKLTIVPSGEVYANVNFSPIGVYPHDPLKKLVFEELVHSTAWFRLRDKEPCSKCLNKYLCPSISNYELTMNKENLCFMKD